MKKTIFLIPLFLSGCAGGGLMPITDTMINEGGGVINKTAGYTADASVAKEHEVHQTLRNRDRLIAKDAALPTVSLQFEMVEVSPGVHVQIMKSLSVRESAKFNNQLPVQPSIHPVWAWATKTADGFIDLGKMFTGFYFAEKFASNFVESAKPNFYGPYQPGQINQSYNPQTAEPFFAPVP